MHVHSETTTSDQNSRRLGQRESSSGTGMPTLDIDECIDKLWNKHEFLSEKDLKEVCLRVKEVLLALNTEIIFTTGA